MRRKYLDRARLELSNDIQYKMIKILDGEISNAKFFILCLS